MNNLKQTTMIVKKTTAGYTVNSFEPGTGKFIKKVTVPFIEFPIDMVQFN